MITIALRIPDSPPGDVIRIQEWARACLSAEVIPGLDLADTAIRDRLIDIRLMSKQCDRVVVRVSPSQWKQVKAEVIPGAIVIVTDSWANPVVDWMSIREQLASAGVQAWLEVTDAQRIGELSASDDHVVVRGSESGGVIGSTSTSILLQQARKVGAREVLGFGAISPSIAAGFRTAGAAGVVLRDELVLTSQARITGLRGAVRDLDGTEAVALGPADRQVRFLVRGNLPVAQEAHATLVADIDRVGDDLPWGWRDVFSDLIPVGQGLAIAWQNVDRSLATVLSGYRLDDQPGIAARAESLLASGSLLCEELGLGAPLVQGPMTRVSDIPGFASAVANQGALPLVALALKRGPEANDVLTETAAELADRAWGVGMLGFAPPEIWQPQHEAVLRTRPSVAVVAGARPDQVLDLEEHGIITYAHAPTARIVSLLWKAGVRRFVLEGYECGGHVGPLASPVLWQSALHEIAGLLQADESAQASVFLAGGIHDSVSSAAAAALASWELGGLLDRVSLGFLMGTAYLFTGEAVTSGAIPQLFQDVALSCDRTSTVTTAVGHSTRVAMSGFVSEFEERARDLTGADPETRSSQLEALTLGRLRMASRAEIREGEVVVSVDRDRQLREGMYMLGDVATMHAQVTTIAALHEDVLAGGREVIEATWDAQAPHHTDAIKSVPVAIVGMSVVAPDSSDLAGFWDTVVQQRVATRPVPPERFDPARVLDPDPAAPDPTIAVHGGFIDPIPFDPMHFGTPPTALSHIEPAQLLALEVTRRALTDAGFDASRIDRSRVGVIIGMSSSSGDIGEGYAARAMLSSVSAAVEEQAWSRLPSWTEESFPGFLNNVTTGRIANRFDFKGPNHTVDSACASSLAAIEAAIRELETGRTDVVITGGADTAMAPRVYLSFAASHALSPRDRAHVFDESADGIVIGEAVGILVLKRLDDARRDGDRVYAVIRGSGSSSDGRGLSLTAPQSSGQQLALRRAYDSCDVEPAQIGLYEAHGTGTVVGDRTEITTISEVRGPSSTSCSVGSIKAQMGHAKAGAGVLGLMKAAMALYHGIRPGQPSVQTPIDSLRDETGSVVLYDKSVPWLDPARFAAVSAFGFGGTNTHLVLESGDGAVVGARRWPAELLVIGASSANDAAQQAERLAAELEIRGSIARNVAYGAARAASGPWRWAIVMVDPLDAARQLRECAIRWKQGDVSDLVEVTTPPSVAEVFPGQAAQRIKSLREASVYLPDLRRSLALVDALIGEDLPHDLIDTIYPFRARSDRETDAQRTRIADTRMAQSALAALGIGLSDLLDSLGVQPTVAFGHSYGEFMALHRAGVLGREDLVDLTRVRGAAMAASDEGRGTMAALEIDADTAAELVSGTEATVACFNAPRQMVVSGARADVEDIARRAMDTGVSAVVLPVGGAFHSALMTDAIGPLTTAIAGYRLAAPQIAVIGNADGSPYPVSVEEIRQRMSDHLMQPVRFVEQVQQAVEAGVTVFVEVGPGSTASSLIKQIDPSVRVVPMERPGRPMSGVLDAIGELWTLGAVNSVQALFEGRLLVPGEDALRGTDDTTWFVDGGGVRRGRMDGDYDGREPMLTVQTAGQVLATPNIGSSDAVVEFQRTMQDFLRVHEQVMDQALGQASGGVRRPRITPPAPRFAQEVARGDVPLEPKRDEPHAVAAKTDPSAPADIQEVLVALISDRTGFDPGVIGAEMDLESELGVDSIKRVEILSMLRERLGIERREGVDLSRLRTVREIVSALQEDASESPTSMLDDVDVPRLVRTWVDVPVVDGEAFRTSEVHADDHSKAAAVLIESAMDALSQWQVAPAELSVIEGAAGPARTVAAAARCVAAERGEDANTRVRVCEETELRSIGMRLGEQAIGEVDLSVLRGNVVLAFGGARGITRAAVEALPDCTVIVVGRSAAEWDLPEGWQALPADVRDNSQVDSVIDAVLAEQGRIDGVVFGSGIVRDAPLAELDLTDARAVIETKVLGLDNVCRSLAQAESIPSWMVAFGSVTGAFGNPAQSAYAAANEAMTVLAASWAERWPTTGMRTIQWGPWFGTGLQGMVNEVVADLLRERGIHVIEPTVGARAFAIEAASAAVNPGFLDIVIGDGPWAR